MAGELGAAACACSLDDDVNIVVAEAAVDACSIGIADDVDTAELSAACDVACETVIAIAGVPLVVSEEVLHVSVILPYTVTDTVLDEDATLKVLLASSVLLVT